MNSHIDSIENQLKSFQVEDSSEELKNRLQKVFESFKGDLKEFGSLLFNYDEDDDEFGDELNDLLGDDDGVVGSDPTSQNKKKLHQLACYQAFDNATVAQRKKVFSALAPEIADTIENAWQNLKLMPYQSGYYRRAFHAPKNPEASLESRVAWFASIAKDLCEINKTSITSPWLARWAKHAFGYTADRVVPVLIAAINKNDKTGNEVFDILYKTVTREETIGIMSDHVIHSLLGSNRQEGWEIIEKTLIAAQRQEGLRNSILANADLAHPSAFQRMLQLIVDQDLFRFSSVARSVNIWLGLLWDSASTKVIQENVNSVLNLMKDQNSIKTMLESDSAEDVYRALWVSAYFDAPSTVKPAQKLLKHSSPEIRFVATWILTQMKLSTAIKAKLPATDDENIQVALMAAVGTDGINLNENYELNIQNESVIDNDQFDRLERLYARLPEKPQKIDAIVWPWTERKTDRKVISGQFLEALGNRPPTVMIPYFKGLNQWNLQAAIRALGGQKIWDELTRNTLVNLLGDLSQDVRQETFDVFKNYNLKDDDYSIVEQFLRRKSVDLRNGLIKIILKGTDQDVLQSAKRLVDSRDALQRLAGLELLRQLSENNRERTECQKMAIEFTNSHKEISKEEQSQITAIAESGQKAVTLADGLGLFDPHGCTPVVIPQKKQVKGITKPAIACLKSLDELVHSHRNAMIRVQYSHIEKTEEKLLGECENYHLPHIDSSKPLARQLEKFPLIEIWQEWFNSRPKALKDPDGLELLRARIALKIVNDWNYTEFQNEIKKPEQRIVAEAILGELDLPKLKYGGIVSKIVSALFYSEIPAGVTDYLLDCTENTYAHVSQEKLNELANPQPKKKKRYYWDDSDEDWRDEFMFERWPEFCNEYINHTKVKLAPEQSKRHWQLMVFHDRPIQGAKRDRPALIAVLKAYLEKIATIDDLVDCLIGPDRSKYDNFQNLSAISSRPAEKQIQQYLSKIDGLESLVDRIRSRILEIELKRGETQTAATRPALALKTLWGGETLFSVMSALNQNKLKIERGWRSDSAESRTATLTHLIKITQPTDADTPESFNQRVQQAINEQYCSEERLLDLAFLAPQWSRLIGEYLQWDGFNEGLYWFLAHMETWYSSATQAAASAAGISDDVDENDDEDETQDDLNIDDDEEMSSTVDEPKKMNAWEKLIQERTPLTAQERSEGAVDVAWFHRTWEMLGEHRWKQMAESAKYAANAAQARKAQFLTDVLLGNKDKKELVEGIQKRNLKDYVRLLGLLPLETGKKRENDIKERYEVLHGYRLYARKLSSLTKPEALRAVEIGMNNLARLAGYSDPLRLEWSLEAESTKDLAEGPITLTKDDVMVTLELDEQVVPRLSVTKNGKKLKSIPAPLKKKFEDVAELAERAIELKKKSSRTRHSLELAMCRGDIIKAEELPQLFTHALVGPFIKKLVFIGDGIAGYPDKGGKVLRDHSGKLEPVKKNEELRIAHAFDLFKTDEWDKWQRECFQAERVQPFKQVFRELYVMTGQERNDADLTRRYSGQQISPRVAFGLFNSREWGTREGVSKIFHDLSILAEVEFQNDIGTAAEVEGLTIDTIRFLSRDTHLPLKLESVPERVFSEVMRDLDLVVSVAHRGEVDPEATASTVEMRSVLIEETCKLMNLTNVKMQKSYAIINGEYAEYSLHLGSGNVHKMPGGAIAILPVHAQHRGRLFLPFADDDPKTAEIISKVLLLANDREIMDPTILDQLGVSQARRPMPSKKVVVAPQSQDSDVAAVKNESVQIENTGLTSRETKRRFEMKDGKSNKFWEIQLVGNDVVTFWGRIGTNGQSTTKQFSDSAKALQLYESLIREKTGKGYVETI